MPLDEAARKLIDDILAGRITVEEARRRTKPAKTREQRGQEAEQKDAEERAERFRQRIADDILHNDPLWAGGTAEKEDLARDRAIAAEADKRLRRR